MQTFLPYPSFSQSAACLDRQRLGKQRVEVWQILRALRGESKGWRNHPAAKMWAGYEGALAAYGMAVCNEWIRRGYRDTMRERFEVIADTSLPPWFGGPIHASHRAALLAKLPDHYAQFGWAETPVIDYVWPTV